MTDRKTKDVGQYGAVAAQAVRIIHSQSCYPPEGWRQAAEQIIEAKHSRDKPCPRSTFISLCNTGYVKNIPPDLSIAVSKNGRYAIEAINTLREHAIDPEQISPSELWRKIKEKIKCPDTTQGQMSVVLGLARAGLLSDQ